jgi:hypothetical protein
MATQKVVPFPEVNRERQEWARVQLVLRQGRSRRLRQWLAVLWFALVLASTWLACRLAGHSPASASEPMLVVFGLALWTFRRMEMGLTQPTLDDRAVMEFGEDFDALPEQDRIHIFDQLIRDSLAGRSWPDERQKEQRTRAESKAYRVLRPVLVALVALYWAVCLLGPNHACDDGNRVHMAGAFGAASANHDPALGGTGRGRRGSHDGERQQSVTTKNLEKFDEDCNSYDDVFDARSAPVEQNWLCATGRCCIYKHCVRACDL